MNAPRLAPIFWEKLKAEIVRFLTAATLAARPALAVRRVLDLP